MAETEDRSIFTPVRFIADGTPVPVVTAQTPYVYNSKGFSKYLDRPMGTVIQVTPEDPTLRKGRPHRVESVVDRTADWGTYKQFTFATAESVYDPFWADTAIAQAFGMTVIHNDQSLRFEFAAGLVSVDYEYGVYASFESPYIGSARDRELLTINATDLEYHAFPHLFCSQDTLPLVISVARYVPSEQTIWLADLWVRPGDILYVPPKLGTGNYLDMHGNRNSARACWGRSDSKNTLKTNTMLGDSNTFAAYPPHYYMEAHPTVHSAPS
jgi:hypothetical protein